VTRRRDRRRTHVLLVIENVPFARDHRARKQADALARAGLRVTVLTQRDPENARFASTLVRLLEYRAPREASGAVGYLLEYAWSYAAWLSLAARQYAREPFGAIQVINRRSTSEFDMEDVDTVKRLGRVAGSIIGLGLELQELRRAAGVQ